MPSLKGEPGFYDVFAPVSLVITDTKQLIPEALFAVVGYDYWLCSGNLPEDTAYTCGVNIGAGNASEIIAEVREIEKTFAVRSIIGRGTLIWELNDISRPSLQRGYALQHRDWQ